jgi:hypothetical protein
MNKNDFKEIEMTPDEKFAAIANLKKNLEEEFIQLGQLLSEIKRIKTFRLKGYKSFKEFVEEEYNMSGAFASKIISIYNLFIKELDVDETTVKSIGVDKLNMIKGFVKDNSYEETEKWIDRAETMPTVDLRDYIKDIREKQKEKSLKDVFIEQYKERMVVFFNCSQKELNFKLALYFQDMNLEDVKKIIKEKQQRFEETNNWDSQ